MLKIILKIKKTNTLNTNEAKNLRVCVCLFVCLHICAYIYKISFRVLFRVLNDHSAFCLPGARKKKIFLRLNRPAAVIETTHSAPSLRQHICCCCGTHLFASDSSASSSITRAWSILPTIVHQAACSLFTWHHTCVFSITTQCVFLHWQPAHLCFSFPS